MPRCLQESAGRRRRSIFRKVSETMRCYPMDVSEGKGEIKLNLNSRIDERGKTRGG